MIGALIEHPKHGLILYDVGAAPNAPELWGEQLSDVFPRTHYEDENRLDRALQAVGYDIADIKAVILSHLHIDHAGGLEFFRNTDVPVYVHEEELKHAFYSVATKEDLGPYLPHYLDFGFNWKALNDAEVELFEGISLYHTPGHTPGLMVMQVELKNAGPFFFMSDMFFIRENFDGRALGWLMRDHVAWHRSRKKILRIVEMRHPNLVFGHDLEVFQSFYKSPEYYD
jgi:glyoxylase-like metal-dependent hydrolase (beta-lactamase superfamily II)